MGTITTTDGAEIFYVGAHVIPQVERLALT